MALQDIFAKDLGWKAISFLLAVVIWYTIYELQSEADPALLKQQTLIAPKPEDQPINPFKEREKPTNLVSMSRSFHIRILKAPEDSTRYQLEPAEVLVSLESNRTPPPNFTDPGTVKVVIDPTDIPAGITETNKQVEVLVPEGVAIMGIDPKEVTVRRVETPEPEPSLPPVEESLPSPTSENKEQP